MFEMVKLFYIPDGYALITFITIIGLQVICFLEGDIGAVIS